MHGSVDMLWFFWAAFRSEAGFTRISSVENPGILWHHCTKVWMLPGFQVEECKIVAIRASLSERHLM